LRHRAADAEKAEADAAKARLENIRRGARVLEGFLADPGIEKTTISRGSANVVVDDE
jgi:hypothetical protein